jgi:glycosyltransferase involved in cell wall biosynthesis
MKASVIIPVLNEIDYIEACLLSVIQNTACFKDIEILLIDGGSTDGTIDIIKKYAANYKNIYLFSNSKKITPAALNIGIINSKGEYIIRLDAHAIYTSNYIDKCISELDESDEDIVNVGGVIITKPSTDSLIAKTISIVLSSPIGVGNSHFRISKSDAKKKFVETVPFGCFRKSIFDEIGLFNEDEHRNEDLEFNNRILKFGKKILCNQEIISIYFSRDTLHSFIAQAIDNGFIVTNKYRGEVSFHNLRHFVPLFFTIFFILSICLIPVTLLTIPVLVLWSIYFFILISFGIIQSFRNKNFFYIVLLPIITFSLHLSYGLGSIKGISSLMKSKNDQLKREQ